MVDLAVVAFAALVAGFTGFGFNMVAGPLLLLVMPDSDVVPVTICLGVLTSGVVAISVIRSAELDAHLLRYLIVGSVPGAIVGSFVYVSISAHALHYLIGCVAAACALAIFVTRHAERMVLKTGSGAMGVGIVSGSLASITGTGGPPVVAYLMATSKVATRIRGTLICQVTAVSLVALALMIFHRQLTHERLALSAALGPAVICGLFVGTYLFRKSTMRLYSWTANATLLGTAILGIVVSAS